MKIGVPSKTAIGPALRRATESSKGSGARICCDEYARYFITRRSTGMGETWAPRFLVNWWLDHVTEIGVGNLILVRTRYLDDAFRAAKASGAGQLVVLGAGYDSRSFRLVTPADGIAAYEVDFPATQDRKRALLQARLPEVKLDHVRFIPTDFMTTSLEAAMLSSDYRSDVRTFFIWEGVTCYLTEDAVRKTFEFIARHSGSGSEVAFDYLHFMPSERAASRRTWHDAEEPLHWGVSPDAIGGFLLECGLELIENVPAPELGARYWGEIGKRSPAVSPTFSLARAVVK